MRLAKYEDCVYQRATYTELQGESYRQTDSRRFTPQDSHLRARKRPVSAAKEELRSLGTSYWNNVWYISVNKIKTTEDGCLLGCSAV
jgi:hypothetical protein